MYTDFNVFLHEARTRQLRALSCKASNILHVGSAGLWYYRWFEENYPFPAKHTGVDLNPQPKGLPEEIRWFQKDVCYLDFAGDNEFDMIFAGQFIEHIGYEAQCRFLCEANRVLKPGGYLVLDSPNAIITRKYAWFQPEHIHELEYQQAYTLVKLAGFEIISETGIIPQKLLSSVDVDEQVNGFVKASDFNQATMDMGQAFSDDPNDCFVWWFCAQKSADTNYDTMLELDRMFYRIKPKLMSYCTHVGKICARGGGHLPSDRGFRSASVRTICGLSSRKIHLRVSLNG